MDTYKDKDELFGKLIIAVVVIVIVSAIVFFGYLGYRVKESASSDRTSIATLGKDAGATMSTSETPVKTEPPAPAPTSQGDASVQKDTLPILVLNGGGPKGSASAVADILKSGGFAKVTTGNSVGDYAGLVVYKADGNDIAAEAVRKALVTKYPSVSVQPADKKKTETTKSTIVVIFGK
ncbi:MAG: LytR C-terminal domain-containing protein [Candidatus Moraniibacteriota bacterium]